jgi:hypothetical protein
LPDDLADGTYALVVAVYQWWDEVRLAPEENSLWPRTGGDRGYLILQHIDVVS